MDIEKLLGNKYTLAQVYGLGPDVITAKTDDTPRRWAVILEDRDAPDGAFEYATGPDIVSATREAIRMAESSAIQRANEDDS